VRQVDTPYTSVEQDYTVHPPVARTVIRAQRYLPTGCILDEVIARGPWSEIPAAHIDKERP
jgi:hypothetical protein